MTMSDKKLTDELLSNPFEIQKEITPEQQDSITSTFDNSEMSIEKREQINQIKNQLVPLDNEKLLLYGANAQQKLSQFSHQILDEVQRKDIGSIGSNLEQLMKKLKEVDPDEIQNIDKSKVKRLFKRVSKSVNELISRYQSVASQIDRISVELDNSKNVLMRDIHMLDQLYDQNKAYFEAIDLFIIAAEEKRDEINNKLLPELEQKAMHANDQMIVQEVNDMRHYVNRLDKRIYDLKLSRQITLQSAPQIRMIQDVNQTLAEKIQSSILTSIPLWKNQMAIAMSLLHQQKASKAQQQVTNTTNELLLKNSEMLKMNTIRTAEENERGIVELETLKITQQNIVDTIRETMHIQAEGKEKRRNAEIELSKMEQDLKTQLLQLQQEQNQRY
ncbi:toxic anion resistance protein [Macrococcoides caseolyticum]|uniref:Toxic anion resistance protein n=2 Tax=Macrococcoides caseolyticum TaxID=69966 RepID=A0ACC9MUR7_9STAP|nr:toxic anion resistance protein [Macrococcus caseolyticus]PKE07514.1 toxic anion resistance protein [Macrococcus caseolyticus]PKE17194.1 toxic anion resistance protein [Macrococcus caseolyticus]PKE21833.1 toxic anion resistance protein [Macrococcus caseolyticus]PKE24510.1 toxic anion resistance protein [Macrococcus caseolyticus]PKE26776.1 toxic anion resistance protein [Macrococcus caseolyticus]